MEMNQVEKPINRSPLRRKLGKEYYCLKQRWNWIRSDIRWAKERSNQPLSALIKKHQSFLLRKLKDVDMHLQRNKITNLQLALDCIHGVIIQPGETFSFWKMVGRPTKSKGYLEGMTLSEGSVTSGTGGGLCQMGNLIYWMAIHTPLDITKRWRHSYDVFPDVNRKIPFGSGATLSYNYIDLQLKNNTDQPFQINLWLDETHLQGQICSAKPLPAQYHIEERNHLFKQQWWGGYTRHNQIWQIRTDNKSQETTAELVTENHAIMMYNPLLE